MLVGYSRDGALYAADNAAALEAQLRDMKRSTAFVDRDDVAIAVEHDTTVGDLAAAAAAAHRAGFAHTYWVGIEQLSTALQVAVGGGRTAATGSGSGSGSGSSAGSGSDPGWGTGVRSGSGAAAPKIEMSAIGGELGGMAQAEVDRVVKARAGVLRACYERALTTTPELAGELAATIAIGADGVVREVKTAGALAKSELATCVGNQLRRIRFPANGGAKLELTLRYAPR
jgi:hypothetical protein